MRHITLALALCLAGCTSTRAVRVIDGKKHTVVEKKLFGLTLTKSVEPQPSRVQIVKETLSAPAKWLLWLTVPVGIVAASAMIFLTGNPVLMKRFGTIAALCMVASVLAGAWLLMSQLLLLTIPLVLIILYIVYMKTKGRCLPFLK